MGKPTGFMEYERQDRSYDAGRRPRRPLRGVRRPALAKWTSSIQGARCMDCGIPYCHQGCPVNNIIPDWNDLVYRGDWRGGHRGAALHQQLPGVHRAHLPRPLRGRLHPEHRRRPGHHQDHRVRHHRQGLGGGLDPAPDRPPQDRQAGGGGRLRPRRPGGGPAAGPGRPRGRCCTRSRTGSAGCCATASRTSS